jgi:hypothetical protein
LAEKEIRHHLGVRKDKNIVISYPSKTDDQNEFVKN